MIEVGRPICQSGTLAPYQPSPENPWDERRVKHFFRRTAFGIYHERVGACLAKNPQELIDEMIEEARNTPLVTAPSWADLTINDFESFDAQLDEFYYWRPQWLVEMLSNGFRDKITLFWHNHFVTQFGEYACGPAAYKYLVCLQKHALGNFKEFVRAIGLDAAMLIYLNGSGNFKAEPNENYARELYELFTLGRDNGYTQQDIVETARAFTGHIVFPCPVVSFLDELWDDGEKTIFDKTGNWGYDDVIDILFAERGQLVAPYICRKIYQFLLSHEHPDEDIIAEMAHTLISNDWELVPVFSQLLKSEHFFSEEIMGLQIKSPVELILTTFTELGMQLDPEDDELIEGLQNLVDFLGQTLYQPINVAGWPGHRSWISSSLLQARWQGVLFMALHMYEQDPLLLTDFAKSVAGDSTDPEFVTKAILDTLSSRTYSPAFYERATVVFKAGIPESYFTDGQWNLGWEQAPYQVILLLLHLFKLPEFQLT